MKYLAVIPLVLVASCASQPKRYVFQDTLPAPVAKPTVRYPEMIRTYVVGPYVEPNHSDRMHARHPIYRVEESARWDLHPGPYGEAITGPVNPPLDAAFSPPPTNDVVLAELNRQREATERVMGEALRLARSYDELQKVINEMKSFATNQLEMRARVANTERRVTEFETELRKLAASPPQPPSPATNNVPAFGTEQPEKP
jgi:hypothetical protein